MSTHSEPQDDFSVVRTEAAMFQRTRQYEKSIKRYTRALELSCGEKRSLVARSQCYLQLGDTAKALADAEAALQDNKAFYKGILRKAEAMYHKGDFEMALVFFHRGKRLRPDIRAFSLGIQKASDAINNCVGSPEQVKLTTAGDLSFFEEQTQTKRRGYSKLGMMRSLSVLVRPMTKRPIDTTVTHRRTVRHLLGELYKDKLYLERLLQVADTSTDSGKHICVLAEECLKYLDKREEFWRQQRPIYTRLHDKRLFRLKYGPKETLTDDILLLELEKIDEEQSAKRYKKAMWRATRCLQKVGRYPDSQVTNKAALRGQLHSCIGNCHLELEEFDYALKHHREDFRIGRKWRIKEGVSRSLDNIGRVHVRQGEYEKAINVWRSKLNMVQRGVETMWLCHELGRCYLELDQGAEALYYASYSLDEAEEEGNMEWQLHSSVLAAQCAEDEAGKAVIQKAIEDIRRKIQKDTQLKSKDKKPKLKGGVIKEEQQGPACVTLIVPGDQPAAQGEAEDDGAVSDTSKPSSQATTSEKADENNASYDAPTAQEAEDAPRVAGETEREEADDGQDK